MTDTSKLSALSIAGVEPYQEKPGEEYMNPNQKEHFRKILTLWREHLTGDVRETVGHLKDESASHEEEFSLELRARDRERKLMKKIDKTLAKLDTDDFGYCDHCGSPIGLRRLEARPTADLCVDCKNLAELEEKQNYE